MDYDKLASELIRQLRGRRSQRVLSRRLGYRSNVVRSWEAGRRFCKASTFFRLCEKAGTERAAILHALYRDIPEILARAKWGEPPFVALLLGDIRGAASIVDISRKTGVNRYTISRWLSGAAEPSLPEFLRMLDVTSLRMLDFVAAIVEPSRLPSVSVVWRRLEISRNIAVRFPWSHAVLRVLELNDYLSSREHLPGFIAKKLGITVEEEKQCLQLFAEAGQIVWKGKHWIVEERQNIDTRRTNKDSRALRAWWSQTGLNRIRENKKGLFSYNLFTVSAADFERLKALHLSYFRQIRSIVSQSTPSEHIVVANVQLFELTDD